MPINPGIALGVEQPKPVDVLGAYGNALSLRNLVNQGRAQDMQIAQAEREQQKQIRLSDLARTSGGDMEKFAAGYGEIDPLGAMDYGIKTKQLQIQQRKAALDQADGFNKLLTGAAFAVKDAGYSQEAYDMQRQRLLAQGVPADMLANLPAQVSPQFIDSAISSGLTAADRLARDKEEFDRMYPGELGKLVAAQDLYRQRVAKPEDPTSQSSGQAGIDPETGMPRSQLVNVDPPVTPYDSVIARLRQGNENDSFLRDKTGKIIPNTAAQDFQKEKAKAGATNVDVRMDNLPLGKAGETKVDEGLLDTSATLMRLSRIRKEYNPAWSEFSTQAGMKLNQLGEKYLGRSIAPAQKEKFAQYTKWRQASLGNINLTIKELTGLAMGVQEANRIMSTLPGPDDSPSEFQAKLDAAEEQTKMALARFTYIKRNRGMSIEQVPLESVPSLINQRGQEAEAQVKAKFPNMKPDEVTKLVRRQLAQEFGLVAD